MTKPLNHVDLAEAQEDARKAELETEFPMRKWRCLCCGEWARIRTMMHVCDDCHNIDYTCWLH